MNHDKDERLIAILERIAVALEAQPVKRAVDWSKVPVHLGGDLVSDNMTQHLDLLAKPARSTTG